MSDELSAVCGAGGMAEMLMVASGSGERKGRIQGALFCTLSTLRVAWPAKNTEEEATAAWNEVVAGTQNTANKKTG